MRPPNTACYVLHVMPIDAPEFQWGAHLGTDERLARQIAAEIFDARNNSPMSYDFNGRPLSTQQVKLTYRGNVAGIYDGQWRVQELKEYPGKGKLADLGRVFAQDADTHYLHSFAFASNETHYDSIESVLPVRDREQARKLAMLDILALGHVNPVFID